MPHGGNATVTTAAGLEWPELGFEFTGITGIGIMLSILGNIVNGLGYVTQNLGHYQTAALKCLYREMRDVEGNEKERLEEVLRSGQLDDVGELGEKAKEAAQKRLDAIANYDNLTAKEQKKVVPMREEEDIQEVLEAGPSPWSNPTWVCGFLTYAVGSLLNAVALGCAPPAMIAPIEGLTLVTNTIVAPMVLPEKLTQKDVVGASVIVVGVVLCVMFGPSNNKSWKVTDLIELWGNAAIIAYTIVMVTVALSVYKWTQWKTRSLIEQDLYDPNSGEHMDLKIPGVVFVGLGYCFIAGTLAAYNGLFTAAWSSALVATLGGDNFFDITSACVSTAYLQVAFFIVANFSMEYWKQKSLFTFPSLFIVPIFQVLLVVLLVLTTGIFYQDFETMHSGPILVFSIGVIITCVGVAILSYQSEEKQVAMVDALWDAIEKNAAPWAKHLKSMHEQALKEKAQVHVASFAQKLKKKVEDSDNKTRKQVDQMRDPKMREEILMQLDEKDLQDAVRELLERMDTVVARIERSITNADAAERGGGSGFRAMAAKSDVRGTSLGTSVLALAHLTHHREEVQKERQDRQMNANRLVKQMGGSRSVSRNVSRRASRPVTPPSATKEANPVVDSPSKVGPDPDMEMGIPGQVDMSTLQADTTISPRRLAPLD